MADIAYSIHQANTESGEYDATVSIPLPFNTTDSGEVIHHISVDGGRIIGFTPTPEPSSLGLTWSSFTDDPDSAEDMYIVMAEPDGTLSVWALPVRRVDVLKGATA